uniref:Uncharacterized protein n=1 Tax=Aegilops tauschii subsp. strangulata TaxID=200361 RepID=A0A452ZC19_AEGTS
MKRILVFLVKSTLEFFMAEVQANRVVQLLAQNVVFYSLNGTALPIGSFLPLYYVVCSHEF